MLCKPIFQRMFFSGGTFFSQTPVSTIMIGSSAKQSCYRPEIATHPAEPLRRSLTSLRTGAPPHTTSPSLALALDLFFVRGMPDHYYCYYYCYSIQVDRVIFYDIIRTLMTWRATVRKANAIECGAGRLHYQPDEPGITLGGTTFLPLLV